MSPKIKKSELPDFQKIGPYSSGDHFSKSCLPRKIMQKGTDKIFWGQTFKNTLYFNLRAADFWKPLTSDYVAQGCFCQQERPPRFLEAPNLWVRCSRLFFPEKGLRYVAQGCFFPRTEGPRFLEAPNLWVCCSRLFFHKKTNFSKPCAKAAKVLKW